MLTTDALKTDIPSKSSFSTKQKTNAIDILISVIIKILNSAFLYEVSIKITVERLKARKAFREIDWRN